MRQYVQYDANLNYKKPKLCIWGLHSYHFYGQNVIIRPSQITITFYNLRPDTLYVNFIHIESNPYSLWNENAFSN